MNGEPTGVGVLSGVPSGASEEGRLQGRLQGRGCGAQATAERRTALHSPQGAAAVRYVRGRLEP